MNQIFISHSHADSDFAEILHNRLIDARFDVWRETVIRPGKDWREEIDCAIKETSTLILIITPEAQASEYVSYEWAFAWGVRDPVIPLLQKKIELHPRLETLQYLYFTDRNVQPWTDEGGLHIFIQSSRGKESMVNYQPRLIEASCLEKGSLK